MYIMVLNDGETWTNLEGCKIVKMNTHYDDPEFDDMVKMVASEKFTETVEREILGEVITTFKS
jgi:hypothetical protein